MSPIFHSNATIFRAFVAFLTFVCGCEYQHAGADASQDTEHQDATIHTDWDIQPSEVFIDDQPLVGYDGSVPGVVVACRMTCSLESDGSVYCWGIDSNLNLTGTLAEQRQPRRMSGFRGIVRLGSPCNSLCGVDFRGDVWCLGSNYYGLLQTGSTENNVTVAQRRRDVRDIVQAETAYSFLALARNGILYGDNSIPPRTQELPLPAAAVELSAGSMGYCVVLSTGRVACYPTESMGRFGPYSAGPTLMSGLEDISHVTVGGDHACALKRDGTVWCWGENELGQTGVPLESSQTCEWPTGIPRYCVPEPRQVADLNDVEEVSAGGRMTCVRRRDRTVWCWGDNSAPYEPSPGQGIIGDGLPNTELCRRLPLGPPEREPPGRPCRRRPSRVAHLTDVATISVGDSGSCARLISGEIWCWGTNSGQSSPVPVRVPFPSLRRDE